MGDTDSKKWAQIVAMTLGKALDFFNWGSFADNDGGSGYFYDSKDSYRVHANDAGTLAERFRSMDLENLRRKMSEHGDDDIYRYGLGFKDHCGQSNIETAVAGLILLPSHVQLQVFSEAGSMYAERWTKGTTYDCPLTYCFLDVLPVSMHTLIIEALTQSDTLCVPMSNHYKQYLTALASIPAPQPLSHLRLIMDSAAEKYYNCPGHCHWQFQAGDVKECRLAAALQHQSGIYHDSEHILQ